MSKRWEWLRNKLLRAEIRLATNPIVVRFSKRYPKAFLFMRNRLSLKEFTGLPLTILLVIFFTNLSILTELAEDFQHSPKIQWFDVKVSSLIFKLRSQLLDRLIYAFTYLASTVVIVGAVTALTLLMLFKKRYLLVLGLLVATCGAGISSTLGKLFFQRARPTENFYYTESTYSFPSGHATLTIAFYGYLLYAFIIRNRKVKKKLAWCCSIVAVMLMMGFSRIYLGVHYFSDVLAGYSLGLLWLLLAVVLMEYKRRKSGSYVND